MQGFIVAGTQRTGTSVIDSTLNSHPDICCLSEVFIFAKGKGKNMKGSYRQFINRDRRARMIRHYVDRSRLVSQYLDDLYGSADVAAMGFKFMLSQAQAFPAARRYIQKRGITVLHVVRENSLKTLVSRVSARSTKLYHSKEAVQVNKIHIPTRRLTRELEKIQAENRRWEQIAANNPYVKIPYEVFSADRERALQPALNQLGLEYVESMSSDLKKIIPDNLPDAVENYDEVAQTLAGTRFEAFLD